MRVIAPFDSAQGAMTLIALATAIPEKGYTSIYPKTKEPEELLRKLSNSRFTVCGTSC